MFNWLKFHPSLNVISQNVYIYLKKTRVVQHLWCLWDPVVLYFPLALLRDFLSTLLVYLHLA